MRSKGWMLVVTVACACGVPFTIPGGESATITSIQQGTVIPLAMTYSYGGGRFSGTAPTGERFEGSYASTHEGARAFDNQGHVIEVSGNTGEGAALLRGSAGTVLDCPHIAIQHGRAYSCCGIGGRAPHAFGDCTDQVGQRYRLEF